MNSPIAIGKIAYDAYCTERQWKSFTGEPLPQWEDVKPDIQAAWAAAAEASILSFKEARGFQLGQEFVGVFNEMQCSVNATAREKGWWDLRGQMENACLHMEKRVVEQDLSEFAEHSNQITCLALVITELSEAIEGIRNGNPPDDKIPNFNCAEAECADAIIRIMDCAENYGWDVGGAIVEKAEMNRGRPHMHGKKV